MSLTRFILHLSNCRCRRRRRDALLMVERVCVCVCYLVRFTYGLILLRMPLSRVGNFGLARTLLIFQPKPFGFTFRFGPVCLFSTSIRIEYFLHGSVSLVSHTNTHTRKKRSNIVSMWTFCSGIFRFNLSLKFCARNKGSLIAVA